MRRFKEVRKEFERSSECLEGAQARNAQAPRGKQHEVEEASNALLNARRGFRSEALDYVLQVRGGGVATAPPGSRESPLFPKHKVSPTALPLALQINVIEAKKRTDILMAVSSLGPVLIAVGGGGTLTAPLGVP